MFFFSGSNAMSYQVRTAEAIGSQGCRTKALLGSDVSLGGLWQNCVPGALGLREISVQFYLKSGRVRLCVVGECHVLT